MTFKKINKKINLIKLIKSQICDILRYSRFLHGLSYMLKKVENVTKRQSFYFYLKGCSN